MTSTTISAATVTARQARSAQVRPAQVRPAVRLTRRGRLVLVALVAFLVVAVGLTCAKSVSAATSAPAEPTTTTVVVQPGQTLWELAEQVSPDRDPREVIRQIADLNALDGAIVSPGQALAVPVG